MYYSKDIVLFIHFKPYYKYIYKLGNNDEITWSMIIDYAK